MKNKKESLVDLFIPRRPVEEGENPMKGCMYCSPMMHPMMMQQAAPTGNPLKDFKAWRKALKAIEAEEKDSKKKEEEKKKSGSSSSGISSNGLLALLILVQPFIGLGTVFTVFYCMAQFQSVLPHVK